MALFQKSVEKKYLNDLDADLINYKYAQFQEYFGNSVRQENIRNSKEEQFQEGFLRELFVKILGYTLNPEPDFNLTTELKNIANSKKADGAVLKGEDVHAVIELKSTNTTDLDSIEAQAFGYKNHHPKCKYVITSNFEKLRFYIQNAVDHLDFNLFNLSREQFSLLWLCLEKENLLSDLPLKIKESSVLQEENITKKLYADYSKFREAIYNNLVKNNPDTDKLLLFKKTQKLLDRFLFIFFAEDRLLLPPNSISEIVKQWTTLKDELDEYIPLYDRFKKYFGYMNTGFKGKKYDIFAYNGGLFAPDEILDNIAIDDDILHEHTLRLSQYDFETDVDVNILGHIFEHSLGEIENVQAEIKGEQVDNQKTKRKKDGIFYTPKYITKYIVENTVGKLCDEKKAELAIQPEVDFERKKDGKLTKKAKDYFTLLEQYRQWLLSLTILDPACGSGAFLNQALDFLLREHEFITVQMQNITGDLATLFVDVEKHILENNIYGVDLNDESIEIAKLSLWLRTAQKGRKLNSLNNNIKCGNSLIVDPEVAGEKAFNWQTEFPEVFAKGGFDVVIGNPPYVKRQNLSDEKQTSFLEKKYQSATYNFDLYLLFIEKGSNLINKTGLVSYINPSKFTSTKTGEGLRQYLDSNCHILSYIDFKEYQVFNDATTYCCIFVLNNTPKANTEYYELNEKNPQEINSFTKYNIEIKNNESGLGWQFKPSIRIQGSHQLKDVVQTFTGIESGADNIYIIERDEPIIEKFKSSFGEIVFPVIKGTNVYRYVFEDSPYYVIVPYSKDKQLLKAEFIEKKHPEIWNYLEQNREQLEGREKGKMKHPNWYGYVYPKNLYKYSNKRLIWTDISIKPQFVIDETQSWHVRTVCSLELNEKGVNMGLSLYLLLSILNSNLFFYFIKNNSNSVRGGYLRYKPQYVKEFPLPKKIDNDLIRLLENKAFIACEKTKELFLRKISFQKYLKMSVELDVLSKNLQNWADLPFNNFITELNNANKKTGKEKLSKSDEMEWMEFFETRKSEAQTLQSEIDKTDREIDQMVYQLYGLTDEEIKIVENS